MAGESTQQRLAETVESWRGHPVLVVGDAMLDEWRFAESDRLCREAPAPVLTLRRRQVAAGGAANTAVNLAALGARAALIAPIGADVAGDQLHDCLDRAGVRDLTVTLPTWTTPVKRRLLAADQILVREDEGDGSGQLTDDGVVALLDALTATCQELTVAGKPTLVICDYAMGALPEAVRGWLTAHRDRFATVALDAHDLARWRGLHPTVVTPSFAEAARLLATPAEVPDRARAVKSMAASGMVPTAGDGQVRMGRDPLRGGDLLAEAEPNGFHGEPSGSHAVAGELGSERPDRAAFVHAHLAELRERTGAAVVAVTLDIDGAVAAGADGDQHRSRTTPVPASHAVGAGDAYLAVMALALAVGTPLPDATHLAQLAATATVSKTGTCVCRRDTLVAALRSTDAPPAPTDWIAADDRNWTEGAAPPGVVDAPTLITAVTRHRASGRRVVFTNGCFDVLHRGHVRYLEQARTLGDLLVVAVNSDESVRRLKGYDRPVNPVEDRVAVLAALACVDYVVVFDDDSPAALIEAVRPEVYVKGGDYPSELVPEAPLVRRLGGEVHTLSYVPDRSTSAIIDRIRAHPRSSPSADGSLSERRP